MPKGHTNYSPPHCGVCGNFVRLDRESITAGATKKTQERQRSELGKYFSVTEDGRLWVLAHDECSQQLKELYRDRS